ncbi:MAG: glycosyltransferase family 4 protein [Silvibacterium sp.]|nr:glycosyltransferase family 4 protein [Silvibacterium sp.]MBV8436648.1 glycosyltransferase family 4 protein [Silvibacterium sp.]
MNLTSTDNQQQDLTLEEARAGIRLPKNRRKGLKVLYALGPGDVVSMYRDLLNGGKEAPFEMSIAFSKLFVDWCDETEAQGHFISWYTQKDSLQHGRYRFENIPKSPLYLKGGIQHYVGSVMYGLKIVGKAFRERPDVLIVDSGTSLWMVFSLVSLLGIPVVTVIHSAFWPMGFPPQRRSKRLLAWLDGLFFRRFAAATVCVSPECERQLLHLAGKTKGPVYQCRAQFRTGFLDRVDPVPGHDVRPLRVLFVGRILECKGIFLIAAMAERLEKEMPGVFTWKIVGGGPDLEALKRDVAARNVTGVVDVAGRLPREELLDCYGWAHAMVVPTTSEYNEGLAMTAAEAVLAGRPVVLSTVVPAWEVLGDAAIKVETGDVDGFVEKFRKLATDRAYYDHCAQATQSVQQQFYDTAQGLGAVLGRAIDALDRRSS